MTAKKPIKFDFNFMMEDVLGGTTGFSRPEIDRMVPAVSKACSILSKFMSDPSRAERVTSAFLQMKKFNIAKLLSA